MAETQQASLTQPPLSPSTLSEIGTGTPSPIGQESQIINIPSDINAAKKRFVDVPPYDPNAPPYDPNQVTPRAKEMDYDAPKGPVQGPINDIGEVPPYNPKQIEMKPEEEYNPKAIKMIPQSSASEVIRDPEIVTDRAGRFDYALGDKSPGVHALMSDIKDGREGEIRRQAVLDELAKSNQDRIDLLNKYIKNGGDVEAVTNMLVNPIARANPKTILEQKFAAKLIGLTIGLNQDGTPTGVYASPDYRRQINFSQDIITMQQVLRNRIDLLEDKLRNQTWLGWGWDEAEYFGGIGFTEFIAFGGGSERQRTVDRMWGLNPDEFETELDHKLSLLSHNTHLQLDYAKMLLGFSNTDVFTTNLGLRANLALAFAPFAYRGTKAIVSAFTPGARKRLAAEIEAETAKQASEKAAAPITGPTSKVEVPEATPSTTPPSPPSPSNVDQGGYLGPVQVGSKVYLVSKDGSKMHSDLHTITDMTYDKNMNAWMGTLEDGSVTNLRNTVLEKDFRLEGQFNPETGQYVKQKIKASLPEDNPGLVGLHGELQPSILAAQLEQAGKAASQKAPLNPNQVLDAADSTRAAGLMAIQEASALKALETKAAGVGQKGSFQQFIAKMLSFTNPSEIVGGATSFKSNAAREYFVKTIFDATNNVLDKAFINPLTIDRFTEAELSSMTLNAQRELGHRLPSMSQRILDVQHIPAETVPGKTDTYRFLLGKNPGENFKDMEQAHIYARQLARLGPDAYEIVPHSNGYAISTRVTIDATKDEVRNLLGAEIGHGGVPRKAGDDIVNGLQRTFRYLPKVLYSIPSKKNLIAEGISKYFDVAAVQQNGIERAARQLWEAIDAVPGTPKLPFANFRTPKSTSERAQFVKFLVNERDSLVGGKVGKFSDTLPEFEANWLESIKTLPSDAQKTAYFAHRRLNDLDAMALNLGIYRDKLRKGIFHIRLPFTNKVSIATEAYSAGMDERDPLRELTHMFTEPLEVRALGKNAVDRLPQPQRQSARVMLWDTNTGNIKSVDLHTLDKGKRLELNKDGIHQIYEVHAQQSNEALRNTPGLVLEKNGYTIAHGSSAESPIYNKPDMNKTLELMGGISGKRQLSLAGMKERLIALEKDPNLNPQQRSYYSNTRAYLGGIRKGKEDEMNYLMRAYLELTGGKTNKEVSLDEFYKEYKNQIEKRPPVPRMQVRGKETGEDQFYIKTPKQFTEHLMKTRGRIDTETSPEIGTAKPWLVSTNAENPTVSLRPHTPQVEPTITPPNMFTEPHNPRFHYLVVKAGDTPKTSDLPFWQLPYRPGGHLQVQNNWMISEPQIERQGIGHRESEWLHYGDNNIFSSKFESDAKSVAEQLYEAKKIYAGWKAGSITQDTAMNMVSDRMPLGVKGKLPGKLPGHFVYDSKGNVKSVPITWEDFKGYFEGPNAFLDPNPDIPILHRPINQSSLNFHNLASRTDNNGKVLWPGLRGMDENIHSLYGSDINLKYATERGDHIASVMGTGGSIGSKYRPAYNIVPTEYLDPLATIRNSFSAATRNGYLSDLKFKTAENFIQTFKDVIDKPLNVIRSDPFRALGDTDWAPLKNNINSDQLKLWRSAYAYRKAAIEFLNIPDKSEKYVQLLKAQLKESIYRNLGERPANWVDKIMPWSSTNDPINALKAYTFDNSKIFDPRQIAIQGTTALHNIAVLGPVKGMQALSGGMWMSMAGQGASDKTIGTFAKLAANMGYPHFEEAYRALERTGFRIISREVGDLNNHDYISAMRETYLSKIRDYGRIFFKAGEAYSRLSAWSGAFQEWRIANPTKQIVDRDIADILAKANLLSMDMTSSAAASWQKGTWSIPLQFASWNARLAEQLLPGYSTRLSGWQKGKGVLLYGALYGFPVALTGAVGVWPIHKSIAKYAMEQWGNGQGNPIDNEGMVAQVLNRGILQTLAAHTMGNYNFSEKLGTGGMSIFPAVARGDKDIWQALTGPTGQMLENYFNAFSPFARWAAGPFDNTNERFPLTHYDFENVFSNLAASNNLGKAWTAYFTGTYVSNHGMDVAHNFTPRDAFVLAMTGAIPQRVQTAFDMSASNKDLSNLQKLYKGILIEKMREAWKAAIAGDFDEATALQKQVKAYFISGGYDFTAAGKLIKQAAAGYESMEERANEQFMKMHPDVRERFLNGTK